MCQVSSSDADQSFGSHSLLSFTEKPEFKNAIYIQNRMQKTGSFEFQIYAQVFKIITWEEVITDRTVLDIKADLVPKEYHNLSL